jgi:hypothetical protein
MADVFISFLMALTFAGNSYIKAIGWLGFLSILTLLVYSHYRFREFVIAFLLALLLTTNIIHFTVLLI